MGFLDNSGDIILDAVLTDLGRLRLAEAKGDSFKIVKFALGDDEINYRLYDKSATTALQDLSIIQTPVLESFTNNSSNMKSGLLTLDRDDHLYLPVLRLNTNFPGADVAQFTGGDNVHLIAVDANTQGTDGATPDLSSVGSGSPRSGVLFGQQPTDGGMIVVDQGIDNSDYTTPLINDDLLETQYIIQMDGRFGAIVDENNNAIQSESVGGTQTIDDDNIKYYTVSRDSGNANTLVSDINSLSSPILGSTGTRVKFKIATSNNLRQSDVLFTRLGFTKQILALDGTINTCKVIDTIIRVTAITFGASIDIPVRFVKHD